MKALEIRKKSIDEMKKTLEEFRQELFNLTIQKKLGQIEKVGRIRVVKKEIARIMTVLSESKKN